LRTLLERPVKFTVTWCFWWEDVNRHIFLCREKSATIVFKMIGATTQNLAGWATGHVGFVQHYTNTGRTSDVASYMI